MVNNNEFPPIIIEHFNTIDLDIKKNQNKSLRFSDQKITPDIVSFIAECICNLTNANKLYFTRKEIEVHPYFLNNLRLIFGKAQTYNELDKFISQPLAMLTYAGVLSRTKEHRSFTYTIQNLDLLEYIAINDKNTFRFLFYYFHKFCTDSNFLHFFNFVKQTNKNNKDYSLLKQKFVQFMIAYTNIGQKGSSNPQIEIYRIFTKIINIYACFYQTKGSVKGFLSSYNITYRNLMYNDLNFRDIATSKEKHISRNEHLNNSIHDNTTHEYIDNLINRSIKMIKKLHPYSEIKDDLSGKTEHVHHIFPKSKYPSISYYLENLIGLTSGQHLSKAHVSGNTRQIDIMYQLICLYAKCENVFSNPQYYTIPNFIHVINIGLELDPNSQNIFNSTMTQEQIKEKLRVIYHTL